MQARIPNITPRIVLHPIRVIPGLGFFRWFFAFAESIPAKHKSYAALSLWGASFNLSIFCQKTNTFFLNFSPWSPFIGVANFLAKIKI